MEIDFSDPDWKTKFQKDFAERFNIPHISDVFEDALPIPSTFCLKMRVHRAGPRDKIYFKPKEAKAAIVTCGGLCGQRSYGARLEEKITKANAEEKLEESRWRIGQRERHKR
ncbi:ATP-dependent 6-phosphofructokinase [Quillaja saponaria]|uniref:ATP-dependent 6-phosphofructokinase n=1 Tax=Quillaja saponaria TaxID=32244 RepID=A0AAD7LFW2_QUISA|nr:ATP-dependent 6-phosphofructokinase [Quillaja saponaria]